MVPEVGLLMMLLHCNRLILAQAKGFGRKNIRVVLGTLMHGGKACTLSLPTVFFSTTFNAWATGPTFP
jgi:hypothetical protein